MSQADGRDADHRVPDGVTDTTVEALGLLSEALEWTERARGHLYSFHQLTGRADFILDDAVEKFDEAGHHEIAERLKSELVGRNVIFGRWTFQIVEDYDDSYWSVFRELEEQTRTELVQGRRHLHEAALKEQRRSHHHPAHRARPDTAAG